MSFCCGSIPSCHDHVGPIDVLRFQFFGVPIDELDAPLARQERGKSDHTKRRRGAFCSPNVAGGLHAPEGVGVEARENHQNLRRWHTMSHSR